MSGLIFACQLTSIGGGVKSHDSQASTRFSLRGSESRLRQSAFEAYGKIARKLIKLGVLATQSCFEAYRKAARKLLVRNPVVVLGLTLHVNLCSLARATGPVFSHGSFCLVKVSGRLREARGSTIKFLDPLYETQ